MAFPIEGTAAPCARLPLSLPEHEKASPIGEAFHCLSQAILNHR